MVTDIFDSVNFSLNENHVIGCREDYDRANAALADFLLFYEQPLELTFPQLFDGYFAVSGEDAQKRRNMLLTLIKAGFIKITSYYVGTPPVVNHPLGDYLEKFPFSNTGYKYSSMPFLSRYITDPQTGTAEIFDDVKEYVLSLFTPFPLSRPRLLDDSSALYNEMENFMEFFEALTADEGVKNKSVFISRAASRCSFNAFINDVLSDTKKAAPVFSLTGRNDLINRLRECKNRSECLSILEGIDDGFFNSRKNALDAIYNKFTFSAFPDHEINVRQLTTDAQTRLLCDVLRAAGGGDGMTPVRYRNETKKMSASLCDSSYIRFEDALEMRVEIAKLHKENSNKSWYDAVQLYKEKLNINLFTADESGRNFCVNGHSGIVNLDVKLGFAAAARLSRLDTTMLRYEKTLQFEAGV